MSVQKIRHNRIETYIVVLPVSQHTAKDESSILHTIKSRKAIWTGHMLRSIYSVKHVSEGKVERRIEMTGGTGSLRKPTGRPQGKERILETDKENTRSNSVADWFWKKIWTCRKTDYGMN